MTWAFLALLLVLALLAIVLWLPLYWSIQYRRSESDDELNLELRTAGGFTVARYRTPLLRLTWKGPWPRLEVLGGPGTVAGERLIRQEGMDFSLDDLGAAWRTLARRAGTVRYALAVAGVIKEKVRWRKFSLVTEVGLEDAAGTGMVVGGIWSLAGLAYSALRAPLWRDGRQFRVEVWPVFDRKVLKLEVQCIFSLRIGDIIYALFIVARRRLKRGVGVPWRSIRSRAS